MLGTLIDTSRWWAKQRANQPAIVTEQDSITYAELNGWANRVANWFLGQGLQVGDRVVVLAPNSLEWCVLAQGVMRAGGVLAPINFRSTAHEVTYMCSRYEPRFIFTDAERDATAQAVAGEQSGVTAVNLQNLMHHCRHEGRADDPGVELTPDDLLVIIPTSGSTGRPKGVVYSHRTLVDYIAEFALAEPQVTDRARILLFAPLSTSAGYNLLTKFLACGDTVFVHQSFDPVQAVDRILDDGITVLMGVPLFFEAMAAVPRFAEGDLSGLRMALCGGAPVSRQLLDTYKRKGVLLRQLYGQTEVGGQATYNTVEAATTHPEKCGYGLPFKRIAVIDDDGHFCPPNTVGQIVVKGPGVMVGYWRDEEATRATLVDGWVRTGDLGTVDENGLLQMVDRLKDIIISGGINVSAAEVERVIYEFPGVQEVAVIAAPDDKFGETPMAIVYASCAVDVSQLINHCNVELSNFKVPRYVVVESEALPRLATGKISKPLLREKYASAHLHLPRVR